MPDQTAESGNTVERAWSTLKDTAYRTHKALSDAMNSPVAEYVKNGAADAVMDTLHSFHRIASDEWDATKGAVRDTVDALGKVAKDEHGAHWEALKGAADDTWESFKRIAKDEHGGHWETIKNEAGVTVDSLRKIAKDELGGAVDKVHQGLKEAAGAEDSEAKVKKPARELLDHLGNTHKALTDFLNHDGVEAEAPSHFGHMRDALDAARKADAGD